MVEQHLELYSTRMRYVALRGVTNREFMSL
jgi:hypothetical protein